MVISKELEAFLIVVCSSTASIQSCSRIAFASR